MNDFKDGKVIIGRRDVLDFPLLDLFGIDVKIDTGAYTSSLHCHHIVEVEDNGEKVILCNLMDPEHEQYNNKPFRFNKYRTRKVKSSNGMVEIRFSIQSQVKIFNKILPIELTLTERGSMKYSVLIGRSFLKKRYIVDTSLINQSYKGKIKIIS